MQKAIRNTTGRLSTEESIDRKDAARVTRSANPIATEEAMDRDYEKNRVAQDRSEQGRDSEKGD